MWKKIWNPSNRKVLFCNIITAFVLNLFLEWMERKSFAEVAHFINERTYVFLFNAAILFMFLSIVFLVKKKIFVYTIITGCWLIIGITNGVVLNGRKTPFTAVDLTVVKSILPVLNSYLELWQIVLLVIALVAAVVLLVCLCLYSPVAKERFDIRANFLVFFVMILAFGGLAYVGIGRGELISTFDNPINGYKDYGVVYGFCVTALDTGIDRPMNYSRERVARLKNKIADGIAEEEAAENPKDSREPNIIFIQLESFFDLTQVKDLQLSEDPIPFFHQLQKETTSGRLHVPVYGAGTINTEFEVITGMSTDYFGTGEYPYRSVLKDKTCTSIAYWLKDLSYESTVIHNNNASFYDRYKVFANLGFDNFITLENMRVNDWTDAGWAKDSVLTEYILDTMEETSGKDIIYTISVQGHGDYPTDEQEDAKITVSGEGYTQSRLNQITYYANQINEMDTFLQNLLAKLSDCGEDTMVIAYGDHLPGLDFETNDLKEGTKYETPYFIWDNFGWNASHRKSESENVTAYELASKGLSQVNIHSGLINQFHQTMDGTKNAGKNLQLLQYDMLYGADFSHEGEDELEPTVLNYSLNPLRVIKVKENDEKYLLLGENFNQYSRVYINGILTSSVLKSDKVLEIKASALKDGDEITIHQVSKTNSNITLNQSEVFVFEETQVEPLYKNGGVEE